MQTQIVKWGNSQGVRIPKDILKQANLSSNDTVEITMKDNVLIIKKIEKDIPHKTIQERWKDFDGEFENEEIDWGGPVGNEVW